ncbi:hypothetical protein T439DRAFT_354405 [Meredithblackwellia eburnea MCA 4105]
MMRHESPAPLEQHQHYALPPIRSTSYPNPGLHRSLPPPAAMLSPPLPPSRRWSSPMRASLSLPAEQYAALYDTLSRRWGRQAEDLAANGEFARIVRKRPIDTEDEEGNIIISVPVAAEQFSDSDCDEQTVERGHKRSKTSHSITQQQNISASSLSAPEQRQISHRRSLSSPGSLSALAKPHASSLRSTIEATPPPTTKTVKEEITTPVTFKGAIVPAETSSISAPDVDDQPVRNPSSPVLSAAATMNGCMDRAEALVNVVRSFEAVLGYRADGWRLINEAQHARSGRWKSLSPVAAPRPRF